MSFFTPLNKSLLVIMFILGSAWAYVEIKQMLRRRKLRKLLVTTTHKKWMDIVNDRSEWKQAHTFENDTHPHMQWFIRCEVNIYERYLRLKGNINSKEHDYLAECRYKIRNVPYEPPRN